MPIDLETGWERMQEGITKVKRILSGHHGETTFTSEEYMMLYTTIYDLCTKKGHDYSQKMYHKYTEVYVEYITTTVMPSITMKHGQFMLMELVMRWSNHKIMVRWLSRFFHYLERYYIDRHGLPSLTESGFMCFRDLVYMEVRANATEAAIALLNREREGEPIQQSLLKNVVEVFVEMDIGKMEAYKQDFEIQVLDGTSNYYRSKTASWIEVDSCPEYMLKAEECLRREGDIVSHYLHSSIKNKLIM